MEAYWWRKCFSVKNATGGENATGLVAETIPELVAELPHKKRKKKIKI